MEGERLKAAWSPPPPSAVYFNRLVPIAAPFLKATSQALSAIETQSKFWSCS
jgi:hypothetical protein